MIVHIHSDDTGNTEHATHRVLSLWLKGVLTGFSIFANGEATIHLAQTLGGNAARPARLACHLNLSEGASCAPAYRVPLLADKHGNLCHTFGSLLKLWLIDRKSLAEQVEIEWRAQIQAVQRLIQPRTLTTIDSHVHVHMLPFLFPIAAKLAEECRIPSIRIVHEPFFAVRKKDLIAPFYILNVIKHLVLRICAFLAIPVARHYNLTWPPRMVGVLYSGHMSAEAAMAGINAAQRKGLDEIEIMFHVGRATNDERGRWKDREFLAQASCSPERDNEYNEASRLASMLSQEKA